jgi:hypothetical protein
MSIVDFIEFPPRVRAAPSSAHAMRQRRIYSAHRLARACTRFAGLQLLRARIAQRRFWPAAHRQSCNSAR